MEMGFIKISRKKIIRSKEVEKSERLSKNEFDNIMEIYKNLCSDNGVYNNIIWQFPTALIAANGFLFQALEQNPPIILLLISTLNFGLLHAFFKLNHNQAAIIKKMQKIEEDLRKYNNNKYSDYIPDFKKDRNIILEQSSAGIISWLLLVTNIGYFLFSTVRFFINSNFLPIFCIYFHEFLR